ncbi:MAG: response regulator transcription factor [Desulfitobacteriaceae bacterium]|nr:response regulator transcription factor [Desulfitobacteriaceae bacterium]MDI6912788.1 response regulator transcription factor [Desulfitobacteriaceae bacterium]
MTKHKVMIVDDHDVVRMGLRVLLDDSEYEVIHEAGGVTEALSLVRQKVPDIVLLDVRLPDGTGIEACRLIKQEFPEVRILMLTSYEDEQAVIEAIEAGASGYLLKQISREGLREAVGKVLRDEAFLDPALAMSVLSSVRKLSRSMIQEEILTKKEKEVILKVAQGKSNRQIAQELYLSEHTVRNHVSSILQKLNLTSRVQLANYVHEKH